MTTLATLIRTTNLVASRERKRPEWPATPPVAYAPGSPEKLVALVAMILLSMLGFRAGAQPAAPPPPAEYEVRLRYEINAFRNERLTQYFAFSKYLNSIGFQKNAGPEYEPEDANTNRMTGTIAAPNTRNLLAERHVKSILLLPRDAKLPAEPAQLVRVNLELHGGL